MDYIDVPHDILKLIYYNKYYLYYSIKNNDNISDRHTTIDSVQLLLYKKFYEKIMLNLSTYAQKYNVEWNGIIKLLNDTTIISGGALLQSIYGNIQETTCVPIKFYHDEYLNIYDHLGNIGKLEKLSHFVEPTTMAVNTYTDIDIFTITDKKIFGISGVAKYDRIGCN